MNAGVYLDHCATSPLRPEARAAMAAAFDVTGNPSSVHASGRASRALLEEARARVAILAGAPSAAVTFTSGGTEANVLAIRSAVAAGARRLLISAIEHDCVRRKKLTPTQREDFKALANELYAAAADAYNKKRKEYEDFGQAYGFKNLGTALGAPASAPSIMRGGAGRKPLSDIFGG